MTEDAGLSYSYRVDPPSSPSSQAPGKAPGSGGDAGLLAVDDYKTLGVAGGVLLVGLNTGGQMLAQPEVEMALQHCTVFRTLEDHARHLTEVLPQLGGNTGDALRVLEMVHASGLFISADDICANVNAAIEAEASLDRPKVCILTCDRPDAAARLLDTMLSSAQLSRVKHFYLVDDSRNVANAAANRDLVEQFNLASPTRMTYFGDAEQRRLIRHLQASQPDAAESVSFLLDRSHWEPLKTYGRTRTLCLLLTTGDRCVMLDDDVLCLALRPQAPQGGLAFSDGQCEAAFYPTAEAWQQAWQPTDFDPLTGHARCLGLPLANALREIGVESLRPRDLAGVSAQLFQSINAATRVLVTQSGTVGDPGTNDNAWLSNLSKASLAGMLSQPGGLATALSIRQCWLGYPSTTVSKRAVMSQVTGLDNRYSLPPYFPALRGEDHLFGSMLDFLFPDSVMLEYDWAVPHLPLEERRGNPQGDSVAPTGGLQLVSAYLSEEKPADASVSFDTRLHLAAARLHQLSELSTQSLLARFRAGLTRAQAFALQTLNDRLADSGELDPQWRQYLEANVQRCVAALQKPADLTGLRDAPPGVDNDGMAQRIQGAAAGYARALLAWPAIREAATRFLEQEGY